MRDEKSRAGASALRLTAAAALSLGILVSAVFPAAAQSPAAPQATSPAAAPKVDPAAVQALSRMSQYLKSLSSFELTTKTSLDLVTGDDQKIQLDGGAHYKVRKDPGAFVIDVVSDDWNRQYLYDGSSFTLYAPKLGYYATAPAPATIQATIEDIENRFGISLPLDDLFRWSGPDGANADKLQSGFLVGTATLDGVKTDHYAFREGDIDWQVWIQQGDQPLPRKVVIVDRRDPTDPAYTANLTWTLNPTLTNEDFTFRPGKEAKRIRLVVQQ
jgi:hypothetical protein